MQCYDVVHWGSKNIRIYADNNMQTPATNYADAGQLISDYV